MSIVYITLYKTVVLNGIVQGDSTTVTLRIDDTNNDGAIDRTEWQKYTGHVYGHIAGDTDPPALLDSTTGSTQTGDLYSPAAYTKGTKIEKLLKDLAHNNYAPKIASLNICYLNGTLIATPGGEVPVETLRVGDLVLTADHGPQPLVWTSSSLVTRDQIDLAPNRRPIRIEAGALGPGLPRRAVEVSAQHRILVLGTDGTEYLISARHLMMAGTPGITLRAPSDEFQLVHLACARHEVLLAEGAKMESFYTGKMAVRALSMAQRLGLISAFPRLGMGENPMTPARPFINHRDYAAIQQDNQSVTAARPA